MNKQTNYSTADIIVLQLNHSSASSLEPVKLARAKVIGLGTQESKGLNLFSSFMLETYISLRYYVIKKYFFIRRSKELESFRVNKL